jgi:LmbE family N-acetylglucosaminyl deacetylase
MHKNALEVIVLQRIIFFLAFLLVLLGPAGAQGEEKQTIEPLLSKSTRLLVLAPHPDDESLGAAGLIQRVLGLGGKVNVVFMTNGDGYPEGVEKEDRITHPTAEDYREYGVERTQEALKALSTLGVKKRDVFFLGFPDGGLCYLLWKFRADPQVYTSPFTEEDHPPASDMIIPHTDYNGRDLRAEIERVLIRFRPTLIATTPPEDEHPDHCATYYFLQKALVDLGKGKPALRPKVLTFLVHFEQWPYNQSPTLGSRLNPPEDFPDKNVLWIPFPLRPREAELKRRAILEYRSQMLVTGPFLLSFAKANELFMIEHHNLAKEMEKTPCCWK